MASGKQLSFAYGEVSRILQYKSGASFYSQALAQAVNGLVRKTGGFSNRPGFVKTHLNLPQENLKTDGSSNIRIMTVGKFLIELTDTIKAPPLDWDWVLNPIAPMELPLRVFDTTRGLNDSAEVLFDVDTDNHIFTFGSLMFPPQDIKIDIDACTATAVNGLLVIHLYIISDGGELIPYVYSYKEIPGPGPGDYNRLTYEYFVDEVQRIGTPPAGATLDMTYVSGGGTLTPPAVCYLIMQEKINGEEALWFTACWNAGHPLDTAQTHVKFDANTNPEVKQYAIYRSSTAPAAGADPQDVYAGAYGLVGRVTAYASQVKFGDFLLTADMTKQPPIDSSLLPPLIANGFGDPKFVTRPLARRVSFFQQRTVFAYPGQISSGGLLTRQNSINSSLGGLAASKMGTPKMMARAATNHPIDAFSFTLPRKNLNEVNHIVSNTSLLVMTSDKTFQVEGDENGIISAGTVNPIPIFNEGANLRVEPDEASDFTYYVNNDLSKLLVAFYASQGRRAQVTDISSLATHLFEDRDVKRVVATAGETNTVWILRRNGELICLAHSPENEVVGFSRAKTDGFIEDIAQVRVSNELYPNSVKKGFGYSSEVIVASIIRDGHRHLEYMAPRNDKDHSRMMYADSAVLFGNGDLAFDQYAALGTAINIIASDYSAGSEITLEGFTDYSEAFRESWVGETLRFKYGETVVDLLLTEFVDEFTMKAVSLTDIPSEYQDVDNSSMPEALKERMMKGYVFLTQKVYGLEHLKGREVSVVVEGAVMSSPLNPSMHTMVVEEDGTIELPAPYQWGYVGLPYEYLLETLRLEAADQRTFTDKGKNINSVGVAFEKTLGGHITQYPDADLENSEVLVPLMSETLSQVAQPQDDVVNRIFPAEWNDKGSLCVRQVDPLPITVAAVYPKGMIGD